jgi:integrase
MPISTLWFHPEGRKLQVKDSIRRAEKLANKKFTFTRKALRDLKPPQKGCVQFYDTTVRGLAVGVWASGVKSFRVFRKFKGRAKRIPLGLFDPNMPDTHELPDGAEPRDHLGNRAALNVRMARKIAMAVMAQLDVGINPTESLSQARHGMTLGKLFELYTAHRRSEGKKTVPALVWMWQRYLGELPDSPRKPRGAQRGKAPGAVNWERRRLQEISYEQVSRLRLDLGEKVGNTTSNRVIELLRAIYNFARKERLYRGENPAEGSGKFQLRSRERFLQADEVQRFFEALDALPVDQQDFVDYVRISLFAGARRGNVLGMRWDELNLDGARWTVSGEFMKNGEPLTIPLVEEAVEILRRRSWEASAAEKAESEWVFPGAAAAGHMGPQRKQWLQLVKAARLPDLRIHDLRRSLGSWMSSSGASTVTTMRALGHRTIDAALIYQQLEIAPVRKAMQQAVTAMSRAKAPKGEVVEMPRGPKAGARGRR